MSVQYPEVEITKDNKDYRIPWTKARKTSSESTIHVVTEEDILANPPHIYHTLSTKYFGDNSYWELIYDANALFSPNIVVPGIKIKIPVLING
ncbi:hypothetical protein Molly5_90 [Maribacter phage Molly_5]|uniref:LysM domain-containing protein n=2 Tax=Mollyvirus TaxID=2948826 RepID=A0A8E4UY61_9CAUD|nr:hypothetical protein M1M29_gp090 [Maribacter phage Molly_1]YP_010357337.1 hypothetical protein M1M30_gp088 [Maribacter phage Colly_1]QQO97778.1 hypothetical protein Molly2_90 [Maribacter phage Molly_2]QQO97978.1 hypothetical protein Molly3_90 [Maribacter phage Molly_3]QQO98178.1 hypothetical protein Molly4_90 [Maribacter phage Molly_4]QQO98378.1 hypothetical protein Molly5_90 [Maribacter phage Molly_5]QQO97375.1 hypothetical protein Colly1_88 [Maribacter phage Colly_1]